MGLLMSLAPLVAMITVEFTDVGMSTLTKAALTKGMSNFVFTVYYNALASLFLLPFFIFRRKGNPITFSVLCRLLLISLIGSLAQILGFTALKYSSPTLLSAMGNLIPIFTFMHSILFRMEKIDIRSSNGVAICMGALISISGAFTVTLYKGPPILVSSSSSSSVLSDFPLHSLQLSNWVFGGILMAITCLSSAIWTILTAATVKQFPEKTIIVFYYCIFSTIFCGIFTFIVERNPNSWKLNSHIQTIAVLYAAVFGVVLRNGFQTWCLHDKGPIFVSMFRPMGISIAVFMAVLFLGETLYAGSIIGAIIVTLGFYTVMWGKWKEQSVILNNEVDDCLESNSQKMPLLHNNAKEEI